VPLHSLKYEPRIIRKMHPSRHVFTVFWLFAGILPRKPDKQLPITGFPAS
jgi:hypothetical protein